jgi:hypothetical protein
MVASLLAVNKDGLAFALPFLEPSTKLFSTKEFTAPQWWFILVC